MIMKNIEDLKAQILELQEQLKKMEEGAAYKELVYPEVGTEYWSIVDGIDRKTWDGDMKDLYRFNTGNYYETKEQADSAFEWQILNTKILNSIALLNKEDNDWEPDWEDEDQEKSFLTWEREEDRVEFEYDTNEQTHPNNMYLYRDTACQLVDLYTQEEFKFWITKENGK